MCSACEEMQLFYAYLDAVEEAKRRTQPWQCEVTIIPQDGEPVRLVDASPAVDAGPAPVVSSAPTPKSGFACDAPE